MAKPSLWQPYWYTLDGQRIRKVKRHEYAMAYRLWAEHKDIREGLVQRSRHATALQLGCQPVGKAAPWTLGRATTQTHRETGPDAGVALPNVYSANYGNLHPGSA